MTSRERFEAHIKKLYDDTPRIYPDGKYYGSFQSMWEQWQACEAQSAARIAQLEGENAKRLMRAVHIMDECGVLFQRMKHHVPQLEQDEVFVAFAKKWAAAIEALTNHQGE